MKEAVAAGIVDETKAISKNVSNPPERMCEGYGTQLCSVCHASELRHTPAIDL